MNNNHINPCKNGHQNIYVINFYIIISQFIFSTKLSKYIYIYVTEYKIVDHSDINKFVNIRKNGGYLKIMLSLGKLFVGWGLYSYI